VGKGAVALAIGGVVSLLSIAGGARADELLFHGNAGGAHALGDPQQREFGFGGEGAFALEVPFGRYVGGEVLVGGILLSKGSPPLDPKLAQQALGTAGYGGLGLRVHPMGGSRDSGLWLDGWAGGTETGNLFRFTFGARVGYDFRVNDGRLDVGPYVGYTQIIQPSDELRPDDAHILSVGLAFGLGRSPIAPKRGDRDKDGIFDDEDACPDVPGIRTPDPKTNGCPPAKARNDRDHDTVFDDEDACPDVPGIRTDNPRTNGCPRKDTDGDGVYDDEDACPSVPGVRTTDPKTNGCPRPDRDNDSIYDDEDACPDVPGVRTTDPKTNGCPAGDEHVHMEGDKIVLDEVILFDSDSPRVRHISWSIVERVARFILANPDVLEINIQGHADAVGTEQHNLYLSRERAESVRRLLIQYGVDQARVTAQAFGKTHLKVETVKAEQANRRVEFFVTRARAKANVLTPQSSAEKGGGP
jgi:OOP family OmpA-OmpF porin